MKKMFSAVLLSFCFHFVYAQDLKNDLYYYKGQQLSLPVNYNAFLVASYTNINLGTVFQQYGYTIDTVYHGTEPDSSQYWKVVKINNDDLTLTEYNILRAHLKNDDHLILAPVYGDTVLRPSSYYFYVKLKTATDSVIVDSIAVATHTILSHRMLFDSLWFELKVDSNSLGNSLEMSNYFYESGLFTDIDPGFIFFFSPTCSGINDPGFSQQWGLENTTNSNIDINACDAWTITKGSSSIKVSVVDEGLYDPTDGIVIPEFSSNLSQYHDALIGNNNNVAKRYGAHGWEVGGVIGAAHNNEGVAGIAPNTTLMSVSANLAFGTYPNPSVAMTDAIDWSWKHGADIINNSWGDTYAPPVLKSSILEGALWAALTQGRNGKGCIVVFSAGNGSNSTTVNPVLYPGNYYPEILNVGAITNTGSRGTFSNGGTNLDVVAPGANVGLITGYDFNANQVQFGTNSGTSYAAPVVSGVAALALAENQCLSREDVNTIIESTAQKVGSYSYYNYGSERPNGTWNPETGYGLVDAKKVVDVAHATQKAGKDLYIKDRPDDVGIEPYSGQGPLYTSEDIWVRINQDGIEEDQSPDYSVSHTAYVYVKVRNKGCTASAGNEQLYLYWAKGRHCFKLASSMGW